MPFSSTVASLLFFAMYLSRSILICSSLCIRFSLWPIPSLQCWNRQWLRPFHLGGCCSGSCAWCRTTPWWVRLLVLKRQVVCFLPFKSSHSLASRSSLPLASCGQYLYLNFALPAHFEEILPICHWWWHDQSGSGFVRQGKSTWVCGCSKYVEGDTVDVIILVT